MSEIPPPVDFRLLLASFTHQALAALGKVQHPVSGETRVDLPWAKYFIDLIAMLEQKTTGNLSHDEQSAVASSLSMLRLNYVDVKGGGDAKGCDVKTTDAAGEDDA
ncbi:MAG TPA: DUF1844 domain-containing protein [Planctomycetota bacterium]|nr:DUF1844 domain-containing protein [Planctomycetota bacterium]